MVEWEGVVVKRKLVREDGEVATQNQGAEEDNTERARHRMTPWLAPGAASA